MCISSLHEMLVLYHRMCCLYCCMCCLYCTEPHCSIQHQPVWNQAYFTEKKNSTFTNIALVMTPSGYMSLQRCNRTKCLKPLYVWHYLTTPVRDGLSGVLAALAMAGLSRIWNVPSYGIILLGNTVTVWLAVRASQGRKSRLKTLITDWIRSFGIIRPTLQSYSPMDLQYSLPNRIVRCQRRVF